MKKSNFYEKTRINNRIRARELRIVGPEGENMGVLSRDDALEKAQEMGLDLIEVTANANPPVARIMDFGKYQYQQKKKQKESRGHVTETKILQVKISTGEHDLELKAQRASKFLKEGHRVKIDLFLAGRAKYLNREFLQERLERVLHLITEQYKIADGPKKSPKGLTVVIERSGSR